MRLWSEMNKLGDRVLYCDTDSIIYEHRPGEYDIPSEVGLGDWEIEDVHFDSNKNFMPMTHFVSTGPKCKAFIIDGWTPRSDALIGECGAKGFTLDLNIQEQINYQGMRNLVTKKSEIIQVKKDRFKRTKQGMQNFEETKDLKLTINKRCLQADYTSLPLGYNEIASY